MSVKAKLKIQRVPSVQIEAVRNGYRLMVGQATQPGVKTGDTILTYNSGSYIWGRVPETPYGEYVFPDFATLTAWMRKHIKHGAGVES